jgi:tripartite-type tricarboxylate transporter receptor subunit TctC
LKPIAVASSERLSDFPDLPTVAETLPGFSATGWQIMVAPKGTPQAIIDKVSRDLIVVCNDADLKKKLGQLGSYSRAMNAAQATAFAQDEQKKWQPVLDQIAAKNK